MPGQSSSVFRRRTGGRGCQVWNSRRGVRQMADRKDELKETAAQCLALAYSTTDPHTRAALLTMAQKLNDGATRRVDDYEAAQRESTIARCCRSRRSRCCSNSSKSSRKKIKRRTG